MYLNPVFDKDGITTANTRFQHAEHLPCVIPYDLPDDILSYFRRKTWVTKLILMLLVLIAH